jgi:hypothetical protein
VIFLLIITAVAVSGDDPVYYKIIPDQLVKTLKEKDYGLNMILLGLG